MSLSVYKSSAGSGKTFTLVKDFLTLALTYSNPSSIRHILALTFTNKAAQEMKDRILTSLHAFSNEEITGKELALFQELLNSKKLNLSEQELKQRAKALLEYILYNYSSFSVSTIDKFNYRLIQTFALDMGLSATAEVELDELELLEDAVDKVIEEAEANELLSDWLSSFLVDQLEEDKSWNVKDHFFRFSKRILNENDQYEIDKLEGKTLIDFKQVLDNINQNRAQLNTQFEKFAIEGESLLNEHEIDLTWFAGGKNNLPTFFKYLKGLEWTKFPNKTAINMLNNEKYFAGKTTKAQETRATIILDDLIALMKRSIDFHEKHIEKWIVLSGIKKNMYGLGLLVKVKAAFLELCTQRNVIPISTFNRMIANIVRNEPAPYIYERLGYRYRNFLLDEFQDTSKTQWYNLLPLVENGLAFGKSSLIVGDAKQAIYRWRGGDADQLVYMPKINDKNADEVTKERSKVLEQYVNDLVLDANWRSSKTIVEFNNYLFTELAKQKPGMVEDVYSQVAQIPKQLETKGYVNYSTLYFQNESDQLAENHSTILTKHEQMGERVFEKIQELENAGFRKKDIAILCRSNHNISELSRFLQPKTDIITSEGLLLFSHPSTLLVLASLKYSVVINETDTNALKKQSILACEIISLLKELQKIKGETHNILRSLAQDGSSTNLQIALSSIGISFNPLNFIDQNPYQQIIAILRELQIEEKPGPYISLLLDKAMEYCKKFPEKTVHSFIEWIEKKGANLSLELPENQDAIRIMTVHKSKGLEFPAVIFPYANGSVKVDQKIWVDPSPFGVDLPTATINCNENLTQTRFENEFESEKAKTWLDTFNIYYVAMTRAERALYIIADVGERETRNNMRKLYQPILQELAGFDEETESFVTGELLAPDYPTDNETVIDSSFEIDKIYTDNWLSTLKIAQVNIEDSESSNFGNLLHKTMRKINHSDEWPQIKKELETSLPIEPELRDKLIEKLDQLFDSNDFVQLFNSPGKRYKERELTNNQSQNLRPDCVIVDTEKAIVIDYKTGSEEEKHKLQIIEYRDAIESIENKPTEAYLIYTENVQIVKVS